MFLRAGSKLLFANKARVLNNKAGLLKNNAPSRVCTCFPLESTRVTSRRKKLKNRPFRTVIYIISVTVIGHNIADATQSKYRKLLLFREL